MKLTEGYKKRLVELAGINESFDRKSYLTWKRKNVTLRGMGDGIGENGGMARWGSGLYTAALSNRAMAKEYGDVYFIVGARPKNPIKFNNTNLAEIWISKNLTRNGYSDARDFFADGKTIAGEMLKLGYDGLEIIGREIVNYTPDEDKIRYYSNEAQLMDYFERISNDI